MASNFLGINRGVFKIGSVTAATTTSSGNDFELRIDTGKSSTRKDVVLALRIFEEYLESNGLPGGNIGTNLPPF